MTDISDLYKEKLSDDGSSYFLDGQWKPFQTEEHEIKIMGEAEPEKFVVKSTHRGPVLS